MFDIRKLSGNDRIKVRDLQIDDLIDEIIKNHDLDIFRKIPGETETSCCVLINKIIQILNDNFYEVSIENKKNEIKLLSAMRDYLRNIFVSTKFNIAEKIEQIDFIIKCFPKNVNCMDLSKRNIMHYICGMNNFEIFYHFYELYPELMNKQDNNNKFPIHICYENFPDSIQLSNAVKITSYYIDSSPIKDLNALISLCGTSSVPDKVLMKIADYLVDENNLVDAFAVCINHVSVNIVEYFIAIGGNLDLLKKNDSKRNEFFIQLVQNPNMFEIFILLEQSGFIGDEYLIVHASLTPRCNMSVHASQIPYCDKLVKYIYEKYNIDVNKKLNYDTNLWNSLYVSQYRNDIYNFIRVKYSNISITQILAMNGELEEFFLYLLKEPDVDINITDSEGNTLLHLIYLFYPYFTMRRAIITILFDRGFDFHVRNNRGDYFFNHIEYNLNDVMMFHEFGIDFSLRDKLQ